LASALPNLRLQNSCCGQRRATVGCFSGLSGLYLCYF